MTDPTSPQQKVAAIADAFSHPQALAQGLFRAGVVFAVVIGSVVLARIGTGTARVCAAAFILVTLGIALWKVWQARRAAQNPEHWFEKTLDEVDTELAGRVRRAYRLFLATQAQADAPSPSAGPSRELARLHVRRALDEVDLKQVAHWAKLRRLRALRAGWSVLLLCFAALLVWPLVVVEGLDVLLARRGVGPMALSYVEDVQLTAEWPAYLDGTGERKRLGSELVGIPEGSEIEVRVVPRVLGRELLLTDGMKRVPLVSDGQGALVARWVADNPAGLKVAARFGDVLLYDLRSTRLEPLSDLAPVVRLAGAPRTLQLSEVERLELTFVASDDHGLSQVDLVLSSGQRQVRTELARLDGQSRFYRGGHALTSEHELLRRAFLPVHVRIEARDGNTATGPLWGRSQEYVLLPEPLGKAIAQRHIALRQFRRAVSAYVAADHQAGYSASSKRQDAERAASEALSAALAALEQEWTTDPAAPRRSLAFLLAQVEALVGGGKKSAPPEAVLLAVDALGHQLAQREGKQLAQDLGQSVEEIAVQARQLRFDPTSLSHQGVLDLLAGNELGANQLAEVGQLGFDLGSVALADLARITRLVKERSFDRAEAAALHLAERLKRATPSFSSTGGGSAGVESGAPRGSPSGGQMDRGQPASSAPEDFERAASEVNQLAQEGASELSELESLLEEAEQALKSDFEKDPALDEALAELRQALEGLPEVGRGTGSASSEAASARSQAEAMAEALEAHELEEGVERGHDAEQALKRARTLLEQGFGYIDEQRVERAERAVSKAIEEAKRSLAEHSAKSAQLNQGKQRERAERQRELAQRARELAAQGGLSEATLPRENLQHLERAAGLLNEAARALDRGDGQKSLELAEDAQAHLERASFESKEDASEAEDEGAEGDELALSGRVPGQEQDRAKDFRLRVEQGLGRGSGRLSPAVRRYAEDLK